jgi:predicted dehydrogenase
MSATDPVTLKLGVVGVGALGRHHARILSGLPGVQLVAVADADAAQAKRIADKTPCAWTTDYRELFGRVDAIVIATPTFAHHSIGLEAIDRTIPMLIEKPLASDLAQARELADAADAAGIVLQVGHVERFNPAFQEVCQRSPSPKYIRTERVSPFAFRSTDIGVVHDLMIHDIDLVLAMTNSEVSEVDAFGTTILGGHEDAVQARLRFANGAVADLTVNRVNSTARRTIEAWSLGGQVSADLTSRKVTQVLPSSGLLAGASPLAKASRPGADIDRLKSELMKVDLTCVEPEVSSADALTAELESFVQSVRDSRTPVVSGRDAIRALEVADRVLQAVEQHCWTGDPAGPRGPFAWWPDRNQHRHAA